MSCVVLSKKEKQAIYGRLIDFMRENGGLTRQQLLTRLSEIKSPLTSQALSAYAAGRSAPNAETLIGLRTVLGISSDFLLTGEEPPPPSITQLKEIVGKMIEDAGGGIPNKDATLTEIDLLLAKIEPAKREAILNFLRQMTPDEKTM